MLTRRIESIEEAAQIIRDGGLVAFPTETVFGLGVDATNAAAVAKLFVAKGRPSDNPLIVHLSEANRWSQAASQLTPHARALLDAFAPGPLTVVVPKQATICSLVTAGLATVGLRIPQHAIARQILALANVPVAAPSANRSGRPSGTTWQAVLEDLDGRIDAVYCQDAESIGIESTVVDCCGDVPVILRPGAITLEQIRQLIPAARELAPSATEPTPFVSGQINSPGLLHPHYQPRAKVELIAAPVFSLNTPVSQSAYCGLESFPGMEAWGLVARYTTIEEYAAGFYEFLREADRRSISTIYVQLAPNYGIGKALLDRQRRAALPRPLREGAPGSSRQ